MRFKGSTQVRDNLAAWKQVIICGVESRDQDRVNEWGRWERRVQKVQVKHKMFFSILNQTSCDHCRFGLKKSCPHLQPPTIPCIHMYLNQVG